VVPSRRETPRIGIVRWDTGTDKEPAMTSIHQYPRSGADRADGVRRIGLALALFVAPWGLFLANLGYAWATRDGGTDETGEQALALIAAHPQLAAAATLAAMIGSLLMVPAALGAVRLIGARAARLALVGGVLVAAGYICYFSMVTTGFTELAMVERGGPVGDYAAVLDASQGSAWTAWVFLLFVLGNLVGTFLLGLALLRSHVVPAWAAAAVMAWPPLHITGLIVGSEWFEVTGAALQGIGFAVVGMHLLRTAASTPPTVTAPAVARAGAR
jgi:hypothetical protein